MSARNRASTRAERHSNHRNRAAPCTASSLVFTSKGISNPDPSGSRPGMSTYLALTFGTLLSSQGTDASFAATSVAPSGASFLLLSELIRSAFRLFPTRSRCFQPYQVFRTASASGGLRRIGPDGPSDVLNFSSAPPRKANPAAIQKNMHDDSREHATERDPLQIRSGVPRDWSPRDRPRRCVSGAPSRATRGHYASTPGRSKPRRCSRRWCWGMSRLARSREGVRLGPEWSPARSAYAPPCGSRTPGVMPSRTVRCPDQSPR
ncbi:hypothetical protein P3T35_003190 [Kitasatospora sp. GP30]|nr:hypothetical protein [Kitasatospora sp. GP30]